MRAIRDALWAVAIVAAAVLGAAPALAAPGDRDPVWGSHGIARISERPSEPASTPDGSLVYLTVSANEDSATVHKLDSEGATEESFGQGGEVLVQGLGFPAHLAVDPQGRILVVGNAGRVTAGVTRTPAIVRLLPNGAPDPSFGTGGRARLELAGSSVVAEDLTVEPSGDISLAVTTVAAADTVYAPELRALRLTADGSPDPSFGTDGYSEGFAGTADAITADPGGGYVLAGATGYSIRPVIARVDGGGAADGTFGTDGVANLMSLNVGALDIGGVVGLDIDSTGRPVFGFAGSSYVAKSSIGVRVVDRLTPGGALDPSFDAAGILEIDQKHARALTLSTLELNSEDRVLIAGTWISTLYPATNGDPAIARLLPDGDPDPSFGADGKAVIPASQFGRKVESGGFYGMTQAADGRVIGLGAGSGRGAGQPGVTARLQTADRPARANLDADALPDKRDTCPRTVGETRNAGCPVFKVAVVAKSKGRSVAGRITVAGSKRPPRECIYTGHRDSDGNPRGVKLMLDSTAGRPAKFTRLDRNGRFAFGGHPPPGAYRVRYPNSLFEDLAACAASSRRVVVPVS